MEGWNLCAIKEFGEVLTGTTPSTKKPEYYGGTYKFISPADLDNGKYVSTSHKLITELGLSASRILPKNAILVGCIGNIGKIGMTADEKSAFNQQINAIVCNKNHDQDFIYYLLTYNRPLLEKSAVKTTLPILNKGNFQEIKLSAPLLPEQRKIAHVLSTVQKAIEQQDKLIKTTTELKKALMQKLFTEGTRGESQKETEIGLVPESWEVKMIGDFSKLYTGGTPSTKNEDYYNPKEIPWMKSGEITGKRIKSVSNFISNEGLNNSNARLLPVNSIVIALNGRGKTRGTTAILDFECTCNQSVVCILPNSKDELNIEFLHYYLSYLYEFIRNLTGSNDRSGLSMSKIRLIPLMIPEIKEQIKIGNTLQFLDDNIKFIDKKKQTLTDLFKTLLHELMTGQRRVHELEFKKMEDFNTL